MSMKLSEAIRIGSQMVPPVHGLLLDRIWENGQVVGVIGACALGAAALGIGAINPDSQVPSFFLREAFGYDLEEKVIPMPEGYGTPSTTNSVSRVVIDLFETYDCTREAVADYLESIGY